MLRLVLLVPLLPLVAADSQLPPPSTPTPSFQHDLLALTQAAQSVDGALYQVALASQSHTDHVPWHISSVKACHVATSTAESIVLHLDPHDGSPYALDYFVDPVPHDGACIHPSKQSNLSALSPRNTTVTVSTPRHPPLPELRAPPQLSPQGEAIKPVQEKSFLEKYWLYIVIALGAMMLAPSSPEEEVSPVPPPAAIPSLPKPCPANQPEPMPLVIRPATSADAPALSRICLLTADAGLSAEPLHAYGELPGLVWALPYVHVPGCTWGFVLVDDAQEGVDAIKGYVLGASDTRALEAKAEESWWPALRAKYPLDAVPSTTATGQGEKQRTEADARYIALLHRGWDPAPAACVRYSPAHLHVDLLLEVQRQGWGRRLMDVAVRHLREVESDDGGIEAVWLGMDPRNAQARRFYERLEFEGVEGAPQNYMGLRESPPTAHIYPHPHIPETEVPMLIDHSLAPNHAPFSVPLPLSPHWAMYGYESPALRTPHQGLRSCDPYSQVPPGQSSTRPRPGYYADAAAADAPRISYGVVKPVIRPRWLL
ncbi:hypothetical protein EW146_g7594 [Bondarzewia mesenterica]|uniref:N-acetyltransferase domain-containing protein n=1 Tax=Bondarzewia mesenterica TaxID=1095465 RepID=A0A4S4LM72_9AGAM|nr:hypothetical protein EW146_g7594 [Bondarzewia mesenterica]